MKGELMLTDALFWQMFDFTFVAGMPYTEEEFESGMKHAVIDEAYATQLYGSAQEAVGKPIDLDYETYTIKGVVKAISPFFKSTYANVWAPYTVHPYVAEKAATDRAGGYVGALRCYLLAASSSDFDAIKNEMQQMVDRINKTRNISLKLSLTDQPISHFEQSFQSNYMLPVDVSALQIRYGLIIILLLLIPSINLIGLTFSKMQKRMAEMGVRRAFGATRMHLITQVLIENVFYSLSGGIIGLLLAYLSLWSFEDLLLKASSSGETMLTLDILHPMIFIYAFCFCLLFNCLSAGVPAWRASHTSIVSSINQ